MKSTGGNGRVTLALIGQKLDAVGSLLEAHIVKDDQFQTKLTEALDGTDEYPGVRGRLRDLENFKKVVTRFLWIFVAALVSLGGTVLAGKF